MLQSLVAPVMRRAASVWIDPSLLDSTWLQLSHTESLYSITGLTNELWIFSRELRFSLNISTLNTFRRYHAISVMFSMCSDHDRL